MSNADLIHQFREADLPEDLRQLQEQVIEFATALRPVYPADEVYLVDFAERSLLRVVLTPDERDNHWWHTGLYIVRTGIEAHCPQLRGELPQLDLMYQLLDQRLGPYTKVALKEINAESVSGICLLSELMRYPQTTFVAPNAYSLAEALFCDTAWYRAIYAGKAPVGFVMLDDNAEKREYFIWRFMIAPHFQKSGYGTEAIRQVIDYVKTRPGATELRLSYIDHEEGPADFYRRLGFVETGEVEEDEVIMRMEL